VSRISILGVMVLVVLCALTFALFTWLRERAFFFVTGPLLGAMIGALVYRRDRSALITGGAVGGLCQGIFAVIVLKRGYIFSDVAMINAPRFLANLSVHLLAGIACGMLLHLALRCARPRGVMKM
jgi:hypothetical protein